MPEQWLQYAERRLAELKPAFSWTREFIDRASLATLPSIDFPQETYDSFAGTGISALGALTGDGLIAVTGESGSGKSGAIWQETVAAAQIGTQVLGYDLALWNSEGLLERLLLEDAELASFIRSSGSRCLFFDSLDESNAAKDVLPLTLPKLLEKVEWTGLRMVIGSQPCIELDRLVEGARSSTSVRVRHILPLTREQIRSAGDEANIDGQAFIAALDGKGASALATRPLTLSLLIEEFKQNGRLVASQAQLHERHIGVLCADTRGRATANTLTSKQRLAVARRIAAFSRLGNHSTISTADGPPVPESALAVESCVGGSEVSEGYPVEVTVATVDETLHTGLFYWIDASSVVWSNPGFRDYLAASWLSEHEFHAAQAVSLVTAGEPRRLVPELYGVASWLAALIPGALEELLVLEPEVVLFGSALDPTHTSAPAIVSALLAPGVAKRLIDQRPFGLTVFDRLRHPDLANQLRSFLEPSVDDNVTVLALLIARGCKVEGLDEPLIALALDDSRPRQVRGSAIAAVRDTVTGDERCKLKSLLVPDQDPDVKGLLLQALWPGCIMAEELFAALPEPRGTRGITSLDLFVSRDLVDGLTADDLPAALRWCTKVDAPQYPGVIFEDAITGIVERAGAHLDQSPVRTALFEFLTHRWTIFSSRALPQTIPEGLGADQEARRELIALALGSDRPMVAIMNVLGIGRELTSGEDIEWLVAQAGASDSDDVQAAIGFFLRHIASWTDAVDRVFAVRPVSPGVDVQLAVLFDAVLITDAPEVAASDIPTPTDDTDLLVALLRALRANTGTAIEEWVALVNIFMEARREDLPGGSICRTILWAVLGEPERTRVHDRAVAFLEAWAPPDKWFDQSSYPRLIWYGEEALLLAECDETILGALSSTALRAWTPAALSSIANSTADMQAASDLCTELYRLDPDIFLESLAQIVAAEARRYGSVFVLRRIQSCWDDRITDLVMGLVTGGELPPSSLTELLSSCLERA
jgi:hypothetical protein